MEVMDKKIALKINGEVVDTNPGEEFVEITIRPEAKAVDVYMTTLTYDELDLIHERIHKDDTRPAAPEAERLVQSVWKGR
jgi:hypothetical protein